MNRKEALVRIGLIMGGTVIGSQFILNACKSSSTTNADDFVVKLSESEIVFLDEIGETIIPTTTTPGAKSIEIGKFIHMMVNDCYEEKDQNIFVEGLKKIEEASQQKFSKSFRAISANQKIELLTSIDLEMKAYDDKNKKAYDKNVDKEEKDKIPPHYFRIIKELTLLGYFTSEVGATKALRYVPVPGMYDGSYPYKKGDKAFV